MTSVKKILNQRIVILLLVLSLIGLLFSLPSIRVAQASVFPDLIPLPNGFNPEGIAIGGGTRFFVGSIPTGAIYAGDLRTGEGALLVEPQEGRAAIGLSYDDRTGYLYVAGGATGLGFVYDTGTGESVAALQLTAPGTFINDVVVTRQAAYFTDSGRPYIYRVALEADGSLPETPAVEEIFLSGDFTFVPGEFNANGIDATPDGRWLILVNTFVGALYRVDPLSGAAQLIDLGGESVAAGDGILVDGKTIYVVRNFLNQIAVVQVDPSFSTGTIVRTISDPAFRIPTTVAEFGNSLYVVNARFDTPPTPDTEYEVVRVEK